MPKHLRCATSKTLRDLGLDHIVRVTPYSREPTEGRLARLMEAQGGRCYLCGERFVPNDPDDGVWPSRDHVHPRSHGFSFKENTLWAHRACNEAKDERWPRPCEVLYLDLMNDIVL